MKLGSEASFWFAIALSSLLHVAVWSADSRRLERSATVLIDDRWSADSVEVGTEVDAAGDAQPAPNEPAPPTNEPASPAPSKPEEKASDAETAPSSPAPTSSRVRTPAEVRASREPKPKAERSQKPDAAAAPSSAGSEPVAAGTAQASQGPTGSMGALELPPGVRHLAPAFTRALPASSYSDPRWSELPTGPLGRTELVIVVDDGGHISDVSFDPRTPPAPVVEQLVKNTILLLKAGVFSLDARTVSAGREHLALEVTLSDEASPEPDSTPRGLFRKGFEPPSAARPGYARFTLNSGRHMEATVRMLSDR